MERAIAFCPCLGVTVERVISDNGFAYRKLTVFKDILARHGTMQPAIKPHCPWTNGKVERLNRTFATEWAYARLWTSNTDRAAGLTAWLHHYNVDRPHLGIGGRTPIDRINNG
jgi:transposase InsO family protein